MIVGVLQLSGDDESPLPMCRITHGNHSLYNWFTPGGSMVTSENAMVCWSDLYRDFEMIIMLMINV